MSLSKYNECRLCARNCGIDRIKFVGYCKMPADLYLSRAALHFWEEPPISGTRGSGTIFFSGCSLSCVFCQNREISRGRNGKNVSVTELSDIMLRLQSDGAHNINLVTPTHYIPSIAEAIRLAKLGGLTIPIVYNTGSYDNVDSLKTLDGLIDVYLPDMKYYTPKTAAEYSNAPDYPEVCLEALEEMYRQTGDYEEKDGIMVKGVVVRHLVLPSNIDNTLDVIDLFKKFSKGKKIKFSLMCQYVPYGRAAEFPEINRPLTPQEYDRAVSYALRRGITDCLIQEHTSASEDFIPDFSKK